MRILTLMITLALAVAPSQAQAKKAAAPPAKGLSLSIARKVDAGFKQVYIEATFRNPGKTPLAVYPPQDGSFHGWLDPKYDLEITPKGAKKPLGLLPRCGNHGAHYENSRVTIEGGKSTTIKVHPVHRLERGKTYTFRLVYEVTPNRYPGASIRFPRSTELRYGPWPKKTFEGKARSKPITVKW